jgi:hypothetical protein
MIFEYPSILWLLLLLPVLLLVLGIWGWNIKKEVAITLSPAVLHTIKKRHVEKYVIAVFIIALLIFTSALPKVIMDSSSSIKKAGEIILLVDVSGSMGAKVSLDAPSRLERVKPVLYDIIENMQEYKKVKISLYGFTNRARSIVPLVSIDDYSYLKESIKKVLHIYSVPGIDTFIGQSVLDVVGKFSNEAESKTIVIFSDGEPYYSGWGGSIYNENIVIEQAVEKLLEEEIRVITVGIGEKEGASIPKYDQAGDFTGRYALFKKDVYLISYLKEDNLKEIAAKSKGEYFFEKDLSGLISLIENGLTIVPLEEITDIEEEFHYLSHWFAIAVLPLWIYFTRRHLLI